MWGRWALGAWNRSGSTNKRGSRSNGDKAKKKRTVSSGKKVLHGKGWRIKGGESQLKTKGDFRNAKMGQSRSRSGGNGACGRDI